jgi:hypothetical protein
VSRRRRRDQKELPRKLDPAEYGGGKIRGDYTVAEIRERMCSRAGCGRPGHTTWSGCADGNVFRPLCAECDVELNRLVQQWWGDPDWEQTVVAYANGVQADVAHRLDIPWLIRRDE